MRYYIKNNNYTDDSYTSTICSYVFCQMFFFSSSFYICKYILNCCQISVQEIVLGINELKEKASVIRDSFYIMRWFLYPGGFGNSSVFIGISSRVGDGLGLVLPYQKLLSILSESTLEFMICNTTLYWFFLLLNFF